MSHGDEPRTESGDGERPGTTADSATEIVLANRLLDALIGRSLVQFRMGYGVHLEFGEAHEVTIETPFHVADGEANLVAEPLTADAAGALLSLNLRDVTSAHVAADGTLVLGLGSASLTVAPHPMYEAWQVRGPDGLLIVCSPGGDHIAVWPPEGQG